MGEYISRGQRGVQYRQESIVERISVPTFEPLFLELQHFIDCIVNGSHPLVSASDGYEALKLSMQIRDNVLEQMLFLDRRSQPRSKELKSLGELESAISK